MVVFDKCCFCIDLKSGCFILGYFNLVVTLILIILDGLALGAGSVLLSSSEDENKNIGLAVLIITVVMLIVLTIMLGFTIALLVGLHKDKPGHVKAFLIYYGIFLIIDVIRLFVAFGGPINAGDIVRQILTILLGVYFLLVIRSQYLVMKGVRPTTYTA